MNQNPMDEKYIREKLNQVIEPLVTDLIYYKPDNIVSPSAV